ncbi:metalloregulator ArsR/SmtB family transcription factor [soil metagenome]|jgi:ArsR family transcriptional regulator
MREIHNARADGSSGAEASGVPVAPRCVSTPAPREIQEASELLKVVGDLTRMRILCTLLPGEELSVGELQRALDMSQSAVSHQLRVLRDANLVRFRRAGKLVYYSLTDQHVHELLLGTLEHIRHD